MCELTDTLNQNICNQKRISQSDYESPLGRKMKLLKSPKTIATIHAFLFGSSFSLEFLIFHVFLFVQTTLEKVVLMALN